jgi:hypothetical protein
MNDPKDVNHGPQTLIVSESEEVSLPPAFRPELEKVLQTRGKERLELILSSPHAQPLVRALPPLEIFMTVQELGKADSLELLSLASPEQFQSLIDFDVWREDRLAPEKGLEWIEILLQDDEDRLNQWIESVDPEFIVLLLKKYIQVTKQEYPLEEKPEEPPGFSLDQLYWIHFKDERAARVLGEFLRKVLALNPQLYRKFMEGAIWELESELEEFEFRWRNGRLADLGFPSYDEALEIYRFLNPKTMLLEGNVKWEAEIPPNQVWPRFDLISPGHGPFFLSTLAGIEDPAEQDRLKFELAALANKAIVLECQEGFSLEGIERGGRKVFHYLNLGLQVLCQEKKTDPREILRSIPLLRIFQSAFGATLLLRKRAEILFRGPWFQRDRDNLSFLDSPHREILEGMLRKRPAFYRDGQYEDFQDLSDLQEAEALLEMIAAATHLFIDRLGLSPETIKAQDWSACHPCHWQEITLSTIFLTTLGNGILNGNFRFEAIDRKHLPSFLHHFFEGSPGGPRRVKNEVKNAVSQWLASAAKGQKRRHSLERFAEYSFQVLEENFGGIPPDGLGEPKFTKGLSIRLGP